MYNGVKGHLNLGHISFDVEYQIDPTTTLQKSYVNVEMNNNFDSLWKLMKTGDKATLVANGMNETYDLELKNKPDILKLKNGNYATISYRIIGVRNLG